MSTILYALLFIFHNDGPVRDPEIATAFSIFYLVTILIFLTAITERLSKAMFKKFMLYTALVNAVPVVALISISIIMAPNIPFFKRRTNQSANNDTIFYNISDGDWCIILGYLP